MFRVIDFVLLIRLVAITTTILSIFLYYLLNTYQPNVAKMLSPYTAAPTIALILTFMLTSKWISRPLWKIARLCNEALYPDLNGTWEGEITFDNDKGKLAARATIRQFLLNTEIDMHTETAKSSTLEATPVISSGQFKLYYTYNTKPKTPGWGTYTGTTIFDVRLIKDGSNKFWELSGYYYTDRATRGRIILRRVSDETNADVSFY